MSRSGVFAVVVALLLSLSPRVGNAAGSSTAPPEKVAKAKALYQEGRSLYNLGDYDKALEKFKAAYLEYNDAAFLFNIAQCQRQVAQYAAAAKSYRTFLRENPKVPNRADIERLATEMDEAIKEQRAKAPPTGTQPIEESTTKENTSKTPETTTSKTPETTPTDNGVVKPPVAVVPPRPWYKNPAGMSLTVGGAVVAIVGGALLGVASGQDSSSRNALTLPDQRSLHSSALSLQWAGVALLSVGAVAAVVGVVVLAVTGRGKPSESKPAASANRFQLVF